MRWGVLSDPCDLQTFSRQQLDKLETYLGQVEIVRDGVLEVVLFPAPESVRLAVDDIHVRDAVRALKKASASRTKHALDSQDR